LERTAIILAEDFNENFDQDIGLLEFNKKPLIKHVVNAVEPIVDEIIIVIDDEEGKELYEKAVESEVEFVLNGEKIKEPLTGALKGFESAKGTYSLLLPSNAPLISVEILELLFDLCHGRSAVIPRWPDQQIEPLHAVYQTEKAIDSAKAVLTENLSDLYDMVEHLRGVRYLSTLVIQELDPDMKTFFNVNTPLDLKKATVLLKPRPQKRR